MNNNTHIDKLLTEINEKHITAFYSWIRLIITLSSGALTLLVGLQKTYVPQNPEYILFLKASWIFLLLSICIGILASYGEPRSQQDLLKQLKSYRNLSPKDRNNESIGVEPRKYIQYAQKALPLTFGGALLFLVLFAVFNI